MQLASAGRIEEESVGRDRRTIKSMIKVISNWYHHVSAAFGISKTRCGREQ